MDFDLLPNVSLHSRSFNALVAPSELMTILEEARHSLILIEHDPLLYEQAVEMTEYISKSMSYAAK